MTDERIKKAAEEAQLAFWAEVVKHFPEITTGCFPPCASMDFNESCEKAVDRWVGFNAPEEEGTE